ncbi:hypothetical protein Tco_1092708 [Tanacetum coccineum]|uniref:Uncharacterized protein n=1 Tax=Tanacetum coccineum TaxID=301880 RepID=A0ABQ5IAN5_9ASTR
MTRGLDVIGDVQDLAAWECILRVFTWSGARMLIKLQGSILNWPSWMLYRLMNKLLIMVDVACRFSQPSIGQPIISQCLQQEEPFCYASNEGSWETEMKERKEQVAEGGWTLDTHATVRKKTLASGSKQSREPMSTILKQGIAVVMLLSLFPTLTFSSRCPPSSLVGSSDRQSSASTAAKPKGTNMGAIDINTFTIEQYLALTRRDKPDVVIPELGNDVDFEIQSQFMSELRCNLFACTDEEDAHEHYNGATTWQGSSHNSNDIAVITKRVDSFGRDIQKLKESVHAIQVACKICEEVHLTKGSHLNEDGKVVEHVKYIGFFEETINKFMEESNKMQAAFDECIRKFKDDMDLKLRMLDDATKNLHVRAEQLTQATLINNMVDKAKTKMRKEPVPFDLPNGNPYIEPTIPPVSFLGHLKKQEDEAQAFRTPEGLKKLKINRSHIRTVKRMLEYLKYVKDVFSSKKPIVEEDTVRLDDRCSTALQNQPPPKENDLGSLTLHCLIVDFVIMDMVEDPNAPLILGRPLLATAQAHIDVFNKQISLGVGEEKILETHEEELELILASDPQSSFTEIQVHSVIVNSEPFIHTQLMSPLYGVFKTPKPCKVDSDSIFPRRSSRTKLDDYGVRISSYGGVICSRKQT